MEDPPPTFFFFKKHLLLKCMYIMNRFLEHVRVRSSLTTFQEYLSDEIVYACPLCFGESVFLRNAAGAP